MERKPSVFNLTGELDSHQKTQLADRSKKTVSEAIERNFSDYDFSNESREYREMKESFDEFLMAVFQKAANREFLQSEERDAFIVNLEIGFRNFYEAAQLEDEKRLAELSAGQEPKEFQASLESQISDLEDYLKEGNLTEEESSEAKREWNRLNGMKKSFVSALFTGRISSDVLTEDELEGHRESVAEFSEKTKEKFDPRQTAEKIVDEYGKILLAHKISLGLEAKYSDEEILEHLHEASPLLDEKEILLAIHEGRKESKKNEPDQVGKLKVYFKIMGLLLGEKKAAAAGFAFGTLAVGAMAPLMPQFLGEYIKTEKPEAMYFASLSQIVSSFSQTELNYRFSNFLSDRMVGEGELVDKILTSVLNVSPEGLSKTDATVLQQQIGRAIENIQRAAEISVKDISADISRVVSLGLSISLRLGDPLLIVPIIMATGINLVTAFCSGEKTWQAQSEANTASDKLTSTLTEILNVKKSRGEEPGLQKEILTRTNEARKVFNKAMRDFQRAGGLPLAVLGVMNVQIAQLRGLSGAEVIESVISSQQLAASLSGVIEKSFHLSNVLQPIADLSNFVREFSPKGGVRPEKWEIELTDVERSDLKVPRLKIKPGDFCAVVGPSGSGKTTLFDVLLGFDTERGLMQVDGHNWSGVDRKAYRDGLVIANQYYALETKSLKDNIVTSGPFNQAAFEDGLAAFGLDKVLKKVASSKTRKGRGQVLNPAEELVINSEDFKNPSGGERKRIALLAIDYRLQTNPDGLHMIILDEPTAGCDGPTCEKIFQRIALWRKNWPEKTIIVSSHEDLLFESLSGEARILGFDFETGKLVQDEILDKARENPDAPFAQLFQAKVGNPKI